LVLCLLINQREGLHAQQTPHPDDKYRIMFYNVENLFDTYNDPSTNDDEFTPEGSKNWSAYRYQKKLNDIARVIIAAGEWNAPAVVGLCEIENFQVLLDLTTNTPLKPLGYQIVHENSKDARGIDVALLYRADKVKKLEHQLIRLEEEAWDYARYSSSKNADKPNRHHRFLCEPLAITLRRQRGDTGKKDSHGHFAEKSH
jgi:predicted extracellular nuclease